MKRSALRLDGMTWLVALLAALFVLAAPRPARAFLNAGAEAGLIKRSADAPSNLKLGFGYGVHGELSALPMLLVGPYYLHYQLNSANEAAPSDAHAVFNALGLRARFVLPLPGSDWHPYAYAGLGYTWATYSASSLSSSGHFLETPIGVGLAYSVLPILQLSLDGALRPATAFGGDLYDHGTSKPSSGWSVLFGAALDL